MAIKNIFVGHSRGRKCRGIYEGSYYITLTVKNEANR